MENLFSFNYIERQLFNQNGDRSNFRQIFGEDGVNMACPKKSYHIVKTSDVSSLGHAFIEKGYEVSTFTHRNGEVIGLNVSFGDRPTKVGECQYNLHITIPNNGNGKGFLSIKQLRLVCSNGMTTNKTMHKDNYIKIPHTWDYKSSIELMEKSIDGFTSLLSQLEKRDDFFNSIPLKPTEVMFHLNKWFFEQELPPAHKKGATLDDFRRALAEDVQFKAKPRYDELKRAYDREIEYNQKLNLPLTMYTAYASVTNYLSRRVEASESRASDEIKVARASQKLAYFDNI